MPKPFTEMEELIVKLASDVRTLRYENLQLLTQVEDAKLLKAIKAFRAADDIASREAVLVEWCLDC